MIKYEYKRIIPRSDFSDDTLNKLGREGGKLLTISNGVQWIFCREVVESLNMIKQEVSLEWDIDEQKKIVDIINKYICIIYSLTKEWMQNCCIQL